MTLRLSKAPPLATARAGFGLATAYRIKAAPRPPSQKKTPRRPDPLAEVFDSEVVPLLHAAPGLRPIATFEALVRRHPEFSSRAARWSGAVALGGPCARTTRGRAARALMAGRSVQVPGFVMVDSRPGQALPLGQADLISEAPR
jgi:hypothetical protein